MAYSHGPGDHELSSSSPIQLSQVNPPYTPGETSESQSEDQLTPFIHLTDEFLVSHQCEANLAIDVADQNRNKPWRPLTLRAPTILASLFITLALIIFIEYINRISIEEKALFFADEVGKFLVG